MQAELVDIGCFADRDLRGIDQWISWTPTRTGWTDVGAPTVVARQHVMGKQCFFQVRVTPGTTCATTAGVSYISLPFAAKGLCGPVVMANQTTNVAIGTGVIDVVNSRAYLPTQAATAHVLGISGWYEV